METELATGISTFIGDGVVMPYLLEKMNPTEMNAGDWCKQMLRMQKEYIGTTKHHTVGLSRIPNLFYRGQIHFPISNRP